MNNKLKEYLALYRSDREFHARVVLYRGVLINIGYALFKLVTGIVYRSPWLISIAVYYLILIGIKLVPLRRDVQTVRRKKRPELIREWKDHRLTGWLLFALNIGLSGIVTLVARQNKSYSYKGFIIYAIAFYTFYRITIALIRIFKDRKKISPVLYAAKTIDLCFAVTSMFTLQTAMFASFAADLDVRTPNVITGTAVAVIVTFLAILMIVRATRNINKLK